MFLLLLLLIFIGGSRRQIRTTTIPATMACPKTSMSKQPVFIEQRVFHTILVLCLIYGFKYTFGVMWPILYWCAVNPHQTKPKPDTPSASRNMEFGYCMKFLLCINSATQKQIQVCWLKKSAVNNFPAVDTKQVYLITIWAKNYGSSHLPSSLCL